MKRISQHNPGQLYRYAGAFFLVVILLMTAVPEARAVQAEYRTCWTQDYAEYTIWRKGGRGLSNILFGWTEILYQPIFMHEQGNRVPIAILGGVLKGLWYTPVRILVGVVETVTFPLPVPYAYRPILYPEFPIPPYCERVTTE